MVKTKRSRTYSVSSQWLVFDTWRLIDTLIVIFSLIMILGGYLTIIPFVLIFLTILELLFEFVIRQSNKEWENTSAGVEWVRGRISAFRLFFIPVKLMLVLLSLFLLYPRIF